MTLRVLHLHSSFDPGGKELRSVQLINAFGPGIEHRIVSAMPGAMRAAARILPGIQTDLAPDFPALQGRPTPARLMAIARAMAGHDLVLTYNFGAMDAVLAHTLFGDLLRLPPLVHHEDGFNQDEVTRRKGSRTGIAASRWAGRGRWWCHPSSWRPSPLTNGISRAGACIASPMASTPQPMRKSRKPMPCRA
jgi:hypothetical protein